jgi:hypothetical protein
MENLVHKLQQDHPSLLFTVGETLCWSPKLNQIFYAADENEHSVAGLLHEVGHALLGHHTFKSDVELLQKEVEAWQTAQQLASSYGVNIDENHVQDCLDTYRDWLYHRSRCPACHATGVQQTPREYHCINCGTKWGVSNSRLRRPYRRQQTALANIAKEAGV